MIQSHAFAAARFDTQNSVRPALCTQLSHTGCRPLLTRYWGPDFYLGGPDVLPGARIMKRSGFLVKREMHGFLENSSTGNQSGTELRIVRQSGDTISKRVDAVLNVL